MKTKSFEKKLTLNKKTIADLSNGEMKDVYGGIPKPFTLTCSSCNPLLCCNQD
jgi:natural product precursor